ncbi:MAG TPA: prepilin-type N-terminal cleavage/methylation domain-containing protein [Candidatus Woesebacteria bacterium]|nr:prepilin-type N-terminal cleavage/methylation domain-containing protein [Candidatus Woesebacteria bacterium]
MKKFASKAFTLVELLIVIGIIGLLAVTVLLALNPAEAQRKARDAQRIKDATTLQAALEQLVNGSTLISTTANTLGGTNGVNSGTVAAGVKQQPCTSGAHWLGDYDLCPYIKNVPVDPQNNTIRTFRNGNTSGTQTINALMFYRARISGSDYRIAVRQESVENVSKLTGDGGLYNAWFEVYSGTTAILPTANTP